MTTGRKRGVVTAATRRAKEMMVGGLVLGHAVGAFIIVLAAVIGGASALLTAALGFAAVVVFFAIGQWIEVIACELEPAQGMGLALVSYMVRVVGVGAGMWALLGIPSVAVHISKGWLLLSMVATVLAWVTGVVVVAARQRVPVYDQEYVPPSDSQCD